MRTRVLAILLLCFCAASLSAGFSLGRPAAVKKRVNKLDNAVRAEQAASLAAPAGPNQAPSVTGVTAISTMVAAGGLAVVSVSASDPDGDPLTYVWTSTVGAIGGSGSSVNWLAPSTPGVYAISCVVSDGEDTSPGSVTVAAVHPGTLKWVFTPSADVNLPAVAGTDGVLYAAASDNKLYAINPDGTQKWVFSTENTDPFSFGPVLGPDGTVYVVADSTKTYAVTPAGALKWGGPSSLFPTNISERPVVGSDGTVYLYNGDIGQLYALDPLTGTGVSTFTALNNVAVPPVIGEDDAVCLVDGDDFLRMVPPAGLAGAVSYDATGVSGPLGAGPAGMVYMVKNNSDLYAVKPDGADKWGAPYSAAGIITEAPVKGADGTAYIVDDVPAVYSVSSTTGAGFVFGSLANLSHTPVPAPDSSMYLVDAGTDLYDLNTDGSVKWGPLAPPAAASITADPNVGADGTVYFSADDGNVYAVHGASALP